VAYFDIIYVMIMSEILSFIWFLLKTVFAALKEKQSTPVMIDLILNIQSFIANSVDLFYMHAPT